MAKIGKCRMCGENKPLINAHIIPRTFFEVLRDSGNYTVLVEPKADKQSKFLQAGDMDPDILCGECDRKFSPLDDYGFKILGVPQPKCRYINPATGKEVGSVIECDMDKLRRSVLAVLWRASISKRWDTVSLGLHEAKVLERIFDVTPLLVDEYSIIIHRLDSSALGDFKLAIFPPIRAKFEGINVYFFYLPGLRIRDLSLNSCGSAKLLHDEETELSKSHGIFSPRGDTEQTRKSPAFETEMWHTGHRAKVAPNVLMTGRVQGKEESSKDQIPFVIGCRSGCRVGQFPMPPAPLIVSVPSRIDCISDFLLACFEVASDGTVIDYPRYST